MDRTALVFDAAAILGIGTPATAPPPGETGFVTVRVPDGLSLRVLCDRRRGRVRMVDEGWYDAHPWSAVPSPGGVYRFRLPPGLLHPSYPSLAGETLPPVALLSAALLCVRSRLSCFQDQLSRNKLACAEVGRDGVPVSLLWMGDQLCVTDNDTLNPGHWACYMRPV